jgi:hypothetical protein
MYAEFTHYLNFTHISLPFTQYYCWHPEMLNQFTYTLREFKKKYIIQYSVALCASTHFTNVLSSFAALQFFSLSPRESDICDGKCGTGTDFTSVLSCNCRCSKAPYSHCIHLSPTLCDLANDSVVIQGTSIGLLFYRDTSHISLEVGNPRCVFAIMWDA